MLGVSLESDQKLLEDLPHLFKPLMKVDTNKDMDAVLYSEINKTLYKIH